MFRKDISKTTNPELDCFGHDGLGEPWLFSPLTWMSLSELLGARSCMTSSFVNPNDTSQILQLLL